MNLSPMHLLSVFYFLQIPVYLQSHIFVALDD